MDIEQLLARYLPRSDVTKEEIILNWSIDISRDKRLSILMLADTVKLSDKESL